jgi:hypothetical protein
MESNMNNHDTQTRTPLSTAVVDSFRDWATRRLRRKEARNRLEEHLTGVPRRFSYCLWEASYLTGLPILLLRRLCRTRQIRANKINGWWMIPRPQFLRLLPAKRSPTC